MPAVDVKDFFADYGEANRYTIKEVIGKGSYGVVCSAVDNFTGEKVRRGGPGRREGDQGVRPLTLLKARVV
jgi:hypothetical protein